MTKSILVIVVLAAGLFLFLNNKKDAPSPSGDLNLGSVISESEATLAVGQTVNFSNISLTFNEFIADYRCPADAQCIEAGAVVVNITLRAGEEELTLNKPSDEVPLEFAGYKVSIVDTNPPAMSGKVINQKDYVVTFLIEPSVSTPEKPKAEDENTGADIVGTEWFWEKTVMNDGAVIEPKNPNVFSLTFSKDGNVSGKTDCNGFGGSYQVDPDNSISFGPFMSTLMFCENSQEVVFSKNVSDSNKVFFTEEGNLVLLLPYDSGSVIFKKK